MTAPRARAMSMLGWTLSLAAFLLVIRAQVVRFDWSAWRLPWVGGAQLLAAGCKDLEFVAGLAVVGFGALWLLRRHPRGQTAVLVAYVLASGVTLFAAVLNVRLVALLGRPFTYQWLYYSDFLRSLDARNAIRAELSWRVLGMIAVLFLAFAGSARLAAWGAARLPRPGWGGGALFLGVAVAGGSYLPFASRQVARQTWPAAQLANPLVAFAESAFCRGSSVWANLVVTRVPADIATAAERSDRPPRRAAWRPAIPIRHIICFVLESVPAEYVEPYGGRYPVTPALNRYRADALLCRNIYAPAPGTNKSLISLLCAVYPWVAYQDLTDACPGAALPASSALLAARGYRTGFFCSSDLRYMRAGAFLRQHGFDEVRDYRTLGCTRATFLDEFLNGVDDECCVDALLDWVAADASRPFFGMIWTTMTHYPYFTTGTETEYGVGDAAFNRYLNALRHGDAAFGRMMRELEARQLLDSTLVVVVGDHGEAFGRHNQTIHGNKIYEENVHVPALFINRQLFQGATTDTIGGLLDVAPTTFELLNQSPSPRWQGRSLLGTNRPPRVYFFAKWSDYLFGYREGDWKKLYNATLNQYELYDLRRDPLETTNLAATRPELLTETPAHLAAWIQYQDRLTRAAMQAGPKR